MQFASFEFLLFLPLMAVIYYLIPAKAAMARRAWLLIASYCFYAVAGPASILFLLLTTITVYFGARGIERYGAKPQGRGRLILTLTVLFNLGMLLILKYAGMFFPGLPASSDVAQGTEGVAGVMTNPGAFRVLALVVPLGISFYTLQAIGYLFDVYRGRVRAEKDFIALALFLSFFPYVVSGPIERAAHMLPQFHEPKAFDYDRMRDGLLQMLWGFFLKLVIADRLAILVATVYADPAQYRGTMVMIAAICFGLEIYADFEGYTQIALGTARVLDFELMNNFDAPYLSGSIGEFWHRWHISLSTWLRDYIYIPLGGNRKGIARKYINIMIVFLISGLWHGADWSFVIWGGLHGLFQLIGSLMKPVRDAAVRTLHIDRESTAHKLVKIAVTFVLVNFAWVFFRATDTLHAFEILKNMRGFTPWVLFDGSLYQLGLNAANVNLLLLSLLVMIAIDLCHYRKIYLMSRITSQALWLRWVIYIAAVLFVVVCGIWGPAYNAASFIYANF